MFKEQNSLVIELVSVNGQLSCRESFTARVAHTNATPEAVSRSSQCQPHVEACHSSQCPILKQLHPPASHILVAWRSISCPNLVQLSE